MGSSSARVRPLLLTYIWVLLPLTFTLVNGLGGIDLGYHWDEPFMVRSARQSIITQEWLPDTYNYPSTTYWLTVSAGLPDILATMGDADRVHALSVRLNNDDYILQARSFLLVINSLTIIVVYTLTLKILSSKTPTWTTISTGLIAASLLAASWEFGYHIRWLAPDGLVALASSLTLLLAVTALNNPEREHWLWLTAAAAGLAVGSKYNAALIGIVVLLTVYFVWRQQEEKFVYQLPLWLVRTGLIAVLVFLLTTPGILLDNAAFIRDVEYEFTHYRERGHFNHTVSAGLEHLWLNLQYLGLAAFSPFAPLALTVVLFVPAGVYALWRRSPQMCIVFLSFPVIYLLFMSTQQVMIVRNLLALLPPLTVLSALGMVELWERLPAQRLLRTVPVFLLVVAFTFNVRWIVDATQSIRQRADQATFTRQALDYIAAHDDDIFCLSGGVYFRFQQLDLGVPPNVFLPDAAPIDYVMYVSSEVNPQVVQANRYNLTETWFGPYEINYNYYPSWEGDARIVVIAADKFGDANLDVGNCNGVLNQ